MLNVESGFLHPSHLRDLLNEIETLRWKRQEEIRDQPHLHLKRFTQQELNDEACPTYKNLLTGRSHRVPSRETIIRIAQYLECSAADLNNLLLAARYLPENLELEGFQLKQALDQAQQIMRMLPYPAMVLTHTLEVQGVNEAFEQIFAFPPFSMIPQRQQHLFHFLFQSNSPIRMRSTFNDQAIKVWEAGVSRCIQLFKHSNVLYQFEPWYQGLVEQFCAAAEFRTYWERGSETLDQQTLPSKILLSQNITTQELLPIQLRHIHISVCTHRFPGIAAYLPVDEAAYAVFASLNG